MSEPALKRSVSFADPRSPARSFVVLAAGESLVLTARALPGDRLVVRDRAHVELARSLPLGGAVGSIVVPPSALAVLPFGVRRVDLFACGADGVERPIDSIALVEPRGLQLAQWLSVLALLAPGSLALLALGASRSITARALGTQLIEALVIVAALLPAVRRWSHRLRWVARFDARVAAVCALAAWSLFFVARAQNLVVHNLSRRAELEGRVRAGRTSWLRPEFAAIAGADARCSPAGPVCVADDPRAFVPEACGPVPEEEPLVRLHHAVRFLGCPSRYEVFDVRAVRDASVCSAVRDGRCCLDVRGERCAQPRSFSVEIPWANGSAERARDPRCPARELLPWRVRASLTTGARETVRAVQQTAAREELCVDLERWGSAHEIIIEHEGLEWRAARAPDARPRAMRVALPALAHPERARVHIAYTARESEDHAAISSTYEAQSIPSGMLLPAALRWVAQPGDAARATLDHLALGPRARDALPSHTVVLDQGRPALHAELWPGLSCGTFVSLRDARDRALGSVALPCAPPGRREREDEPWVLWRFALRDTMPPAWVDAMRTLTDELGGGAVRFRSEAPPGEVFLAYRGWDGMSVDLRVYSQEPRTMGIESVGEVMRGHVSQWRMFAGPPPPREGLCCQLDGVWSVCPAEFNDYWRCQGTINTRPGCVEAWRRCTFIDWAVERAAQRDAGAARSSAP